MFVVFDPTVWGLFGGSEAAHMADFPARGIGRWEHVLSVVGLCWPAVAAAKRAIGGSLRANQRMPLARRPQPLPRVSNAQIRLAGRVLMARSNGPGNYAYH
ncbi:hypothetical protein JP75_24455 [Devosia riboflavina]|uniref:Uncharacterized protein n=1 Tax=Devosia riboflavina TaxID=46914 RepID=A0A087LUW6_9HYPH|nr:hypothetical protein JP75_24455 [Devosia riboflavina]